LAQVTGSQQPAVDAIVVRTLWQQGIAAQEPPWAIKGSMPDTAITTAETTNRRHIALRNSGVESSIPH